MKLRAMLLGAIPGLLLAGCGGGGDSKFFVGTWHGQSEGIGLTLLVGSESTEGGTTHLQGTLSSNKMVCLSSGPVAGTVVDKAVQLSAHGSGSRSRFTLVDIAGELMGDKIMGTLTMSGDNQNEEMCDFDKAPIVLHK
jgi:hypothetical protein